MSAPSRRRPSAAMVVAIVALVVAMAGSALAGPLKSVILGSSIKKHSIPGNRLIDHTLTRRQINLGKLGTVPVAALALNATNALKLGGQPASSYLPASKLLRWSFKVNKGQARKFTFGPLKFLGTCKANGANTDAELAVSTTEPGTYVSRDTQEEPGAPGAMILTTTSMSYNIIEQDSATANDGNSSALEAFDPAGKVAIFSTAETIGLAINTPGADCRFFGYLVNDA